MKRATRRHFPSHSHRFSKDFSKITVVNISLSREGFNQGFHPNKRKSDSFANRGGYIVGLFPYLYR
jgi:hypothetical protein